MTRFVFPKSVLNPKLPDEMFADQVAAFREAGFATSLFALDGLSTGAVNFVPALVAGETIVYRGWMMSESEYSSFEAAVKNKGASLLTSSEKYLATHHLPRWYPLIQSFTPETVVLAADVDLVGELKSLGWKKFFIKDYVKSLKTAGGSLIDDPEKAKVVASEMEKFRGSIEGGFCVRRVESFVDGTEVRFFILKGRPYASDDTVQIPAIVGEVSRRIPSPFFSVDVVKRSDGQSRIVEVGDGQVSDIVGWSPERLVEVWKRAG